MARHLMLESPAMGRRVHVWCFGSFGMPLVVFPTAAGFAHEWQRQGMVEALADLIGRGKIKLYCPESNIAWTWLDRDGDPRHRLHLHKQYERFVLETLVPFIEADCHWKGIPLASAGSSLGGLYASLFALKFPRRFRYALCMSGRYDATHFTGGYSDLDVYFNNPLAFVPGLHGSALEDVREHTHLALVCGQGAFEEGCIEETQALADLLAAKGISHDRDIWGHDVRHDWMWWRRQAVMHLSRRFDR